MKRMKPPEEPCSNCKALDWRAIKQHGEILGYRCNKCGVGVVWADWMVRGA